MAKSSRSKKDTPPVVAILAEREYEDVELWYPYYRFQEVGYQVTLVGCGSRPTVESEHGYPAKADRNIENVNPKDFHALIIPGGWGGYHLRTIEPVLELVRSMDAAGRVVASSTQGGWVLASAGVLRGRAATANRALRDDMKNAGCRWTDDDVVVDKNLITARRTRDVPAFCKAIQAAIESL